MEIIKLMESLGLSQVSGFEFMALATELRQSGSRVKSVTIQPGKVAWAIVETTTGAIFRFSN